MHPHIRHNGFGAYYDDRSKRLTLTSIGGIGGIGGSPMARS